LWKGVLGELIPFYTREGDDPEADRLRRLLRNLPSHSPSTPSESDIRQEAGDFAKASCRMQDVLRDLNLHPQYMQHLPDATMNLFPPIHRAVHDNRKTTAHFMSSLLHFDLADVDILRRQLLHLAAESSDQTLLEIIIQQKRELLEGRDTYRMTALCIAALYGHSEFFQRLVEAGANIRARDAFGRSVLCIASGAGHLPIVMYILSQDVDPNDDTLHICSPLHAAVAGGYEEIVKILLHYGARVDWISDWRTPIEIASARGFESITNLLEKAKLAQESQQRQPGENQQTTAQAAFPQPPFVNEPTFIIAPSEQVTPTSQPRSSTSTSTSLLSRSGEEAATPSPPSLVGDSWASMTSSFSPLPEVT
jgi:hypothetical protein